MFGSHCFPDVQPNAGDDPPGIWRVGVLRGREGGGDGFRHEMLDGGLGRGGGGSSEYKLERSIEHNSKEGCRESSAHRCAGALGPRPDCEGRTEDREGKGGGQCSGCFDEVRGQAKDGAARESMRHCAEEWKA